MGFPLTDLIIESILRDGFENARRIPSVIEDVFSQLVNLPPSLASKYGDKELNKIKNLISKEVSIIHAFPVANTPMPCISIQLLEAPEDVSLASMDDYQSDVQVEMSPEDLAKQILVQNIQLLSYDPNSGILSIADSADLSSVHPNLLLVDANGAEFPILGGVSNVTGSKQLIIAKQVDIDLMAPALIKSSINYNQYRVRNNAEQESLLLGIHSKDALITKYLYTLVKYFIESRKKDLVDRGFMLATYKGADFNANKDFEADFIFTRFLTVSGKIYNSWNSDQVIPIDWIDVQVKVQKDDASSADLGITNQTVTIEEDDTQTD